MSNLEDRLFDAIAALNGDPHTRRDLNTPSYVFADLLKEHGLTKDSTFSEIRAAAWNGDMKTSIFKPKAEDIGFDIGDTVYMECCDGKMFGIVTNWMHNTDGTLLHISVRWFSEYEEWSTLLKSGTRCTPENLHNVTREVIGND